MILVSLILFSLFVFLELSITWSKYPALLELVSKYHGTTNTDLQKIYVAAIESVTTEFVTPVTAFYTIFIPAVAAILVSLIMIKDNEFGKIISIIGLVSGICNAFSVIGGYFFAPFGQLVILGSFLILFWFLGVGIKMLQLRKRISIL